MESNPSKNCYLAGGGGYLGVTTSGGGYSLFSPGWTKRNKCPAERMAEPRREGDGGTRDTWEKKLHAYHTITEYRNAQRKKRDENDVNGWLGPRTFFSPRRKRGWHCTSYKVFLLSPGEPSPRLSSCPSVRRIRARKAPPPPPPRKASPRPRRPLEVPPVPLFPAAWWSFLAVNGCRLHSCKVLLSLSCCCSNQRTVGQ